MLTAALVVVQLSLLGLVTGALAPRVRPRYLDRDNVLLRTRPWERSFYERLHIRSFKDRLPDAGTWFAGTSKRTLPGTDDLALATYTVETRRAEYVHWANVAAPATLLTWLPPAPVAAIAAVNALAHAPFIAVQRYNRARIAAIAERRARPFEGPAGGSRRS